MFNILSAFLEKISQRLDIILAVFIVSVIFMLVIPLPTVLIDFLIAMNMALAVILLMVGVYLTSPLQFSAFPAVLLISTLFRLALSISTTRLILLQADAGRIVETFGQFVVGGNLIVGLVIFLILTIVQFIVITKGSERVAEVSARFSLDALPGKQLSIDADMRSGALSLEEAKSARSRVQQESKLYGSMDGAMKFVKGDAIASLIIVFVNLLGGLAIGMLQRGLPFSEAIQIYAILSIGDGLIAQIPALFISITAGIIVTRVTDEEKNNNLGRDIGMQLGHEPKALLIAACMLVVFALIPGFPTFTFIILASTIGVPALLLLRAITVKNQHARKGKNQGLTPPSEAAHNNTYELERDIFAPTVPLLVELAPESFTTLSLEEATQKINTARLNLYFRLGVPLPIIQSRFNKNLKRGAYKIFVNEIPTADGIIRPQALFIFDQKSNLDLFTIPSEEAQSFLPDTPTLWVNNKHQKALDDAGIHYKTPIDVIRYHMEAVIAQHSGSFIGIQEVRHLMAKMETDYPDLIKEAQRILPIQSLAELLRRLIQEYVSIRDLRQIFTAVVEWGSKEKDPVLLVEHIRSTLSRQISYQYSLGNNLLPAYLLDTEIEETVRNAIRQTSVASYISLDPDLSKKIIASIKKIADKSITPENTPVLITSMDIRRYIRRLIEGDIPQLPVLSYQEITSEITLQPLGRISLNAYAK